MTVVDRLNAAKDAISSRARDCGRDPAEITLVCVTKTFPAEAAVPLLEAGHRVYGENKVQEARTKWGELRQRFSGVELHLIGPLQSNKTREAVETFDVIESVDRAQDRRGLGGGDSPSGQAPAPARAGQHGRRAAKGRRVAAGGRRLHRRMP